MIDGIRRCQAQLLIGKRTFFHVEYDERGRECWYLPGLKFASMLLRKVSRVGIRHVVDQIDFPGTQGGQAHLIFLFRSPDDAIEVGQTVALRISLEVVLKPY